MRVPASLEEYLKNVDLERLLKQLGVSHPDALAKTVQHFATKEGGRRDRIVSDYFGEHNINSLVEAVTDFFLSPPQIATRASVLDVGAGSGFFTTRVAQKTNVTMPEVRFYAMDITPAMLWSLAEKNTGIVAFLGVAENISASIHYAKQFMKVPMRFDAVFSTLMLHHSPQPGKVFESIKTILKQKGKAVVIDLCKHGFQEFKTEMGDVHLGFDPDFIRQVAERFFTKVQVRKLGGIRCTSSGRAAEIFVSTMQNS